MRAQPVRPPELGEAAVGEAEEADVPPRHAQMREGGERLALAELAERHVVGVGRPLDGEVLLEGAPVAVAVGHEHHAQRCVPVGETEEEAADADRLIVGVGGEDDHSRTRGEGEGSDGRGRPGGLGGAGRLRRGPDARRRRAPAEPGDRAHRGKERHGGERAPSPAEPLSQILYRCTRLRAITRRWISLVPSPMIMSGASR